MSYPIPFFADYIIHFPESYRGQKDISGITIKNAKGKIIKPKGTSWILKNPDSANPKYQELYNKNVVGTWTQTLYDSDIRAIYNYLH
jgi:hypothetical protein